MQDALRLGPIRQETQLAKWENHRTPDDGAPDEVIERVAWLDLDGQEITDALRIAELEARYRASLEND